MFNAFISLALSLLSNLQVNISAKKNKIRFLKFTLQNFVVDTSEQRCQPVNYSSNKFCLFIYLFIYWARIKINICDRWKDKQILSSFLSKSCKINPEGTCGPIWPEVVPLALSSLWPYYCIKKIVNMWSLKSDIFREVMPIKLWEYIDRVRLNHQT